MYVTSQSFNIEICILPLYVNLLRMESNLTKFGALSLYLFLYIVLCIECGIYTQYSYLIDSEIVPLIKVVASSLD